VGLADGIVAALVGRRVALPPPLVRAYPELERVQVRRGGLPPRVGGWALGRPMVDAITLRRTIFVGPRTTLDPALLLHELRHVEQFFQSRTFPLQYLWEFFRHGYHANRFEREARNYAASRLAAARSTPSHQDV
jgi:hypothetical protein